MRFFLFFFIIGLIEIALFARVSMMAGPLTVLLLCLLSALVGFDMVVRQGMAALRAAFSFGAGGPVPLGQVFEGICKVAAGMLFILPGFLSDILAILLLLPALRRHLQDRLLRRYPDRAAPANDVLEGDYERVDENDSDKRIP